MGFGFSGAVNYSVWEYNFWKDEKTLETVLELLRNKHLKQTP